MSDGILTNTYEILGEIGSGGGGTVYKAYHKRLRKMVVIKKTHIRRLSESENRREADILKNLRHTYLPQVLDFIEEEESFGNAGSIGVYTVMDYVEGESFQSLLDRGYIFSQQQAVKYGSQLLEALVYLHEQRIPILHGDIKPDNVILTPEDNICLIDFNVSGVLTGGDSVTVGYTPGYAAPEQIKAAWLLKESHMRQVSNPGPVRSDGTELLYETDMSVNGGRDGITIDNSNRLVDARADLYSAGAFLYKIVTGRKPGEDGGAFIPLSQYEGFSNAFAAVVDKALSQNPNDRFANSREMLYALSNFAGTDRRYRLLLVKQGITIALLLVGILVSILIVVAGRNRMRVERDEYYERKLMLIDQAVEGDDETEILEILDECEDEFPERIDAQVMYAEYLYKKGEYEVLIDYVTPLIDDPKDDWEKTTLASLYYLNGNAYYESGDIDHAVKYLGEALRNDQRNPEIYRDYAIVLAVFGRTEDALESLEKAKTLGITEDQTALVHAEISAEAGDFDAAKQEFDYCITHTDDDYTKMRAYALWGKMYDDMEKTQETLNEKASLLEKARISLPQDQTMLVLQELAQTYIDLFSLTHDGSVVDHAAGVLEEIISHGWGSMTTWNNLSILYQEIGDFDRAMVYAERMVELYPDRYEPYKRCALIEAAVQQTHDVSGRDYHTFEQYYLTAKKYFEKSGTNQGDMEMQILDNAYMDMKTEGWL